MIVKEIYSDNVIFILEKDAGIPTVLNRKNNVPTVVDFILEKYSDRINTNLKDLGLISRLDTYTSGLLLGVFDNDSANYFNNEIKQKRLKKYYLAWVYGNVKPDEGKINYPLYNKTSKKMDVWPYDRNPKKYKLLAAETFYKVAKYVDNFTLLEILIYKGNRHQIRAHLDHINYSIVGDPLYKKASNSNFQLSINSDDHISNRRNGQLLHAYKLELIHPTRKFKLEFVSEVPKDFHV